MIPGQAREQGQALPLPVDTRITVSGAGSVRQLI